jgi:hypothetical protein
MDFFQSHQTVPLLSYLLPYSERSIALVKRLAGSPKGAEIDPNLPHANKSYLAHAFLYTLMDSFSRTKAQAVAIFFFHIPERSIALVKRLGSPKGAEIDPNLPHAKSVTPRYTHSYILMDSFSRTKLCPSRCYLTFFHIPERSIALVKRLAGSPKELKLIPTCPTLTKVLPKVAHAFLYTWMDFFNHQPAQAVAISTFFHIPNVQLH